MKKFIKVVILLMIIFSTTTYYRVISFDYQVSKVNRLNDTTDETVNKIFEMSTYYIPLEKVLVKYYQSKNINQHDCNLLSVYTIKPEAQRICDILTIDSTFQTKEDREIINGIL